MSFESNCAPVLLFSSLLQASLFGASKVKLVKFVEDSRRLGCSARKLDTLLNSGLLASNEVKSCCVEAVTMKAANESNRCCIDII